MAETTINFVLEKITSAAVKEVLLLWGVGDQVEKVKNELYWIQAFLKDVDRKVIVDEKQKQWLKEVREVGYQIEDTIDTFLYEVPHKKLGNWYKSMFRKAKMFQVIHNLRDELNQILTRLQEIREMKVRYGINSLGDGSGGKKLPIRLPVLSDIEDPDVIGLDDDKDNIVKELLDKNTTRRAVVSIVGQGGLGKTTLAKKVYNSNEVGRAFDIQIWVTISRKFELINVLRKIRRKLRPIDWSELGKDEEYFLTDLFRLLEGKKYLLVFDDVWSGDLWMSIEKGLPNKNNGSRILMTTRIHEVAKEADLASEPYKLSFLSDESSLELLLKKAIPYREIQNVNSNGQLFDLAKRFVIKCGGLPLALVVLGGLLAKRQHTHSAWSKVLEIINWHANGQKCCTEIIGISYDDLPLALKSCFMYFAAFPEDYVINAKSLLRMWVAEGFIPEEENRTLEDTAESFLEDLVQRCLLIVKKKSSSSGRCKTFKMHDLLRDVAIYEANNNNFLTVFSDTENHRHLATRGVRRAALQFCPSIDYNLISSNTRSLICFGKQMFNHQGFRLLKVLSFNGINNHGRIEDLHAGKQANDGNWLERLVHLRYLGFRNCTYYFGFRRVSFRKLNNFETLDLTQTPDELAFANDPNNSLWEVPSLRNVISRDPILGPSQWDHLKNIQTLKWVKFEKIPVLADYINLRKLGVYLDGSIIWEHPAASVEQTRHVKGESNINNPALAEPTMQEKNVWDILKGLLEKTRSLDSLSVRTSPDEPNEPMFGSNGTYALPCHTTLETLRLYGEWSIPLNIEMLPINLVKFTLQGSVLRKDPMPVLERLPSLRILQLFTMSYVGTTLICSTGGFPSLQKLILRRLPNLSEWEIEEGAMPILAHLAIDNCYELHTLPELQIVPSLQELIVHDPSIELHKRIQSEELYKIKHIPCVRVIGITKSAEDVKQHYKSVEEAKDPQSELHTANAEIPKNKEEDVGTSSVKDDRENKRKFDEQLREEAASGSDVQYKDSRVLDTFHVLTKSHTETLSTAECISIVLKKIDAFKATDLLQQASSAFSSPELAFIHIKGCMKELEKILLVIQSYATQEELAYGLSGEACLNQMAGVMKEVEKVIDELLVGEIREQPSSDGSNRTFISSLTSIVNKLKQKSVVLPNLLDENREIPLVEKNLSRYHESQTENYDSSITTGTTHQFPFSPSMEEDFEMIGMEKERRVLEEWLTDQYSERMVISVCGMGGVGKTTLAKKLYMDHKIRSLFQCSIWVSISRNYEIGDLFRTILKQSAGIELDDISDHGKLMNAIHSHLKDKRFLLVLDGIWDTNLWMQLNKAFPALNTSSRVVITTIREDVASLADKNHVIYLQTMARDKARDLFFKGTFKNLENDLAEKLLDICDGLPLAVTTVASVLNEVETAEWRSFGDQFCNHLDNNPKLKGVVDHLCLSLNDLPPHLKNCILHCSFIPSIKRNWITKLWVAEGFIKEGETEKTAEEIAGEYLKELVNHSLIQVVEWNSEGEPKRLKMNNFLRIIALNISKKGNFGSILADFYGKMLDNKIRRVAIWDCDGSLGETEFSELLRSFVSFRCLPDVPLNDYLSRCKLLRVLCLRYTKIKALPDCVAELFNLRFLDLRYSEIERFPESFERLLNLELLDLRCSVTVELGCDFANFQKLHHLLLEKYANGENSRNTAELITGLSKLKSLQTLKGILLPSFGELDELKQLRNLSIWPSSGYSLTNLRKPANLVREPANLVKLQIEGRVSDISSDFSDAFPNLKVLRMINTELPIDPLPLFSQLKFLVELWLCNSFKGSSLTFQKDQFVDLKKLIIFGMEQPISICIEEGAMKKLCFLELSLLKQLTEVPTGIIYLRSLSELIIWEVPGVSRETLECIYQGVSTVPKFSFISPLECIQGVSTVPKFSFISPLEGNPLIPGRVRLIEDASEDSDAITNDD